MARWTVAAGSLKPGDVVIEVVHDGESETASGITYIEVDRLDEWQG